MPLWICLRWPEASNLPGIAELHQLALAMLRYSPRVACFRQNSVVLEVEASLSLFGGTLSLSRSIRQTAQGLDSTLLQGMAPSATAAWLLAGSSKTVKRVIRVHHLNRHLSKLSVRNLPEARPHLAWLDTIGCRTLGDLRKLPRQGLQQRSSTALLQALDAAHAQTQENLAWFIAPARFRQSLDLDFHIQQAEPILGAAQALLLSLCGWLQNRQEALHDFTLLIHHEKGRQSCPPTQLLVRFSAPSWRVENFNRVLKEQLQRCQLKQPAIRLELLAGSSHPRVPSSDTLFPDPFQHVQEEQRLLDLLAARLGEGCIRRPQPIAHHLPELANRWAADLAASSSNAVPASVGAKPRPFWLLPQPQYLPIQHERPVYQGRPLRLVQGPERIETGWHTGTHHRRDYFVAEDAEGARYWVYRERETGEDWFLHGLFA